MNLQNHAEWQNYNGMPLITTHFRFGVFTNFDKKFTGDYGFWCNIMVGKIGKVSHHEIIIEKK